MSGSVNRKAVVFVVDDSDDVRKGLKALVEAVGLQCEVFDSPREFLKREIAKRPCCLLLDVRFPEISGLDVQRELAGLPRQIPAIIMTGHGDIAMSVKAMKAGAIDFLTKPLREQDVLDAIYSALDRDRNHLQAEERLIELRVRLETLSGREREIMPLVTSGLLNKQIAAEIGLSEVTVKVHRHNLMQKLGAKSLPELVRMADLLGVRRGSGAALRKVLCAK
ncbi:MAG TPA: response regulator [Xanthobacteraceae bacterium]|nr:response regulator [Xanthobacteraceae bacterium]